MAAACVLVPIFRPEPLEWEALAMSQLSAKLGDRDILFVAPAGFDSSRYRALVGDRPALAYDAAFFTSREGYNALMVHEPLYRDLESYEFVLIHHTDAFVIEDQLDLWCDRGFDYVGAPFWADWGARKDLGMIGVGNGGFSLRRIEPMIRTLEGARRPPSRLLEHVPRTRARIHRGVRAGIYSEDWYWSMTGALRNVAPIEVAVEFAFEMGLEYLGDIYETLVPFGCHKYWNLDYVLRHRRGERRGEEPEYERVIFDLMRRTGNLDSVTPTGRDAGLLP